MILPVLNITGNLTINDGIISGFSTSNYACTPDNFAPSSNSWEMVFKIRTGNDVTTEQCILAGTKVACGWGDLKIKNSKFRLALSSNGTSGNIANELFGTYTVLANTDYWIKLIFSGTAYTFSYSQDGETYTEDVTVNSTTSIYQQSQVLLGADYYNGNYYNPFLGSIDLKESYININNQRWWTGLVETQINKIKTVKENVRKYYKYGTEPNVNIVGNPTISNGVASNFSNTNYLTLPEAFNPGSDPWEICLKIKMHNNDSKNGVFIGNNSGGYFRFGFTSTNNIALLLSTTSNSWSIGSITSTSTMVNDEYSWVKATFDSTKYQIFLSTDGENYNLENTLNSSSIPAYQSLSTLGAGNNSNNSTPQYTQGSIDLKNSYIKINDKEFWHGTLLEESTEADYDFYKDVDVYKIVKQNNTYKAVKS